MRSKAKTEYVMYTVMAIHKKITSADIQTLSWSVNKNKYKKSSNKYRS